MNSPQYIAEIIITTLDQIIANHSVTSDDIINPYNIYRESPHFFPKPEMKVDIAEAIPAISKILGLCATNLANEASLRKSDLEYHKTDIMSKIYDQDKKIKEVEIKLQQKETQLKIVLPYVVIIDETKSQDAKIGGTLKELDRRDWAHLGDKILFRNEEDALILASVLQS